MKKAFSKLFMNIKKLFKEVVHRKAHSAPEKTNENDIDTAAAQNPDKTKPGKEDRKKKERKPWSKKRKIIFFSIIGLIVVLTGSASIYAYSIWHNPMGQFDSVAEQAVKATNTPAPTVSEPLTTDGPTPTIDPYDELVANADFSMLENIVNIMLIGVDHADERDTWSGKHAFHSDVMIVLSVNTDTNKVSLISLPRDTYAKIPGVSGIYKLNASIDCGGGWPTEEGFSKVCEAAEWMIGGIPINYYYAVDMGAVKGLVDAIDGLDYDLDLTFKIQGRSYKSGVQHMDGQAVLDYLRVRKNLPSGKGGDLNRINRQKRMLIAIFEKIKESSLLTSIPDLLDAFDGNLYTNTTLPQTAALAAFAYNVDSDNIAMYSMGGGYRNIFNWNFVLTDQSNRVEIIKEVYGYDAPKYNDYTSSSAQRLWENMQADVIKKKSAPVLTQVRAILDADALLPPYPTPVPDPTETMSGTAVTSTPETPTPTLETPTPDPPTPTPDPPTPTPDPPTPTPDPPTPTPNPPTPTPNPPTPTPAPPTPTPNPDDYRKFGDTEWNLYHKAESEYSALMSWGSTAELAAANVQLKADIESLCSIFGIGVPSWRVNYERGSNEIYIDFN